MKIASSRVGDGSKRILMLHGILGMGANWRSFANKLVKRKPDWSAILVDLRHHGGSRGFPSPNTVAACADDLLGIECDAVLGHSFGGKVALALGKTPMFIVDSTPGPRRDVIGTDWGALGVVQTLRTIPKKARKREDFIEALMEKGVDAPTAQWLAMSAHREGDDFVFDLDLDAIQAMLDDYFSIDLWKEAEPEGVYFIAGSKGSMPDEDRVRTHATIVEAGHWVHVDAPDALLDFVATRLD